ncbi:MAG: response regulator transcription factor [Terriglobales bacterium]
MNGAAAILIVDDEPQIRRVLRTTLAAQGYTILEAGGGEEALASLRRERADLVLLDMNMPGLDGLETCRAMRAASDVPIIMLTVRNAEHDKVRALDAGADDYVAKPFGFQELLARIRAALRRAPAGAAVPPVATAELRVDFDRRTVVAGGKSVHLTPKEFDLLRELAAAQGKPVSHRKLLQAIWGPEYGEEAEYLRVTINQLRKKIEPDPGQPRFLLTEPRVGYRFVAPPADL